MREMRVLGSGDNITDAGWTQLLQIDLIALALYLFIVSEQIAES